MVQVEGYPYYLNRFLHSHLNINAVHKMKLQALICVHGHVVDGGVPEGGVKLKLKGVKLGDGEKKSAHNICLNESAFTLFLQTIVTTLCLFVPFHQSVIAVDVLILVNGLHGIFIYALLDKTGNHLHILEQLITFGINRSGIHQLTTDKPAVLKECLSVDHQLA